MKDKTLLLYVALQTLLLLVFYFPCLNGSASFYFRDISHYIEPFLQFTSNSLRAGHWPLWNPYLYCGMPQMAVLLQNAFYPPTLLAALVPFNTALALTMIFHQVLAGAGVYLLAIRLGWGRWPALISAATLAMCGYFFSLSSNFQLVETAAWCPISIWAFLNMSAAFSKQNTDLHAALPGRACIAALCTGMLLLAGHPEIAFSNLLVILALIAICAYDQTNSKNSATDSKEVQESDPNESIDKNLSWQVRALVLGALLAMPVILPCAEWLSLSRRSEGLNINEALLLSANYYDLLGMLLPQALGDLQLRYSEFRSFVMPSQMVPYVNSAYLGPVVLSFSLWAIADQQFKARWFFLAAFVLSLLVALGDSTPVMPFLIGLFPKLSLLRFPAKFLFFPTFILAVLASRGAFTLLQDRARIKVPLVIWSILLVLGVLGYFKIAPVSLIAAAFNGAASVSVITQASQQLGQSAIYVALIGLLTCALAFSYFLFKKNGLSDKFANLALSLLSALLVYSLLGPAFEYSRNYAPGNFFDRPSLLANEIKTVRSNDKSAQYQRTAGLYLEHFTVPKKWLDRDSHTATVQSIQYSRQVLKPNCNIDFAEPSPLGFEASSVGDYYYFFLNCYGKSSIAYSPSQKTPNDRALLNACKLTSTRFLVTQVKRFEPQGLSDVPVLPDAECQMIFESKDDNIRLYSMKDSLPRAYFAENVVWIKDRSEAVDRIFSSESTGFDPVKETIIEGEARSIARTDSSSDGNVQADTDRAEISEASNDSITIQTETGRARVLVLTDQFYPGWEAEVDGTRTEILRANSFMRAVELPSGKHQVRFVYRPKSFYIGLLLFAISLALMIYYLRSNKAKV